MNIAKLVVVASLATLSVASIAADQVSATTREQRMDEALERYRAAHPGSNPAPAAASESGFKGGVARTGAAIERGAKRAGNAVARGLEKTGDAIHRGADKITGKPNSKADGDKAP